MALGFRSHWDLSWSSQKVFRYPSQASLEPPVCIQCVRLVSFILKTAAGYAAPQRVVIVFADILFIQQRTSSQRQIRWFQRIQQFNERLQEELLAPAKLLKLFTRYHFVIIWAFLTFFCLFVSGYGAVGLENNPSYGHTPSHHNPQLSSLPFKHEDTLSPPNNLGSCLRHEVCLFVSI